MQDWMLAFGEHYSRMQRMHPHDRLLVVFDIDGTILDMRYLVYHVLRWYDQDHGTAFFARLTVPQIDVHENVVTHLLAKLGTPAEERETILAWYYSHYWTSEAIERSHYPFDGVMPIIRWLQRRHNTYVALNTGRFEKHRWDTLRSLNKLGAPDGVFFDNRLLHMRANGWARSVAESKVFGMRRFRNQGYRVIAMFDNEPDNLAALDRIDPNHNMLLLHANTIYQSSASLLPPRCVQGERFDPSLLARSTTAARPAVDVVGLWSGSDQPLDRPLTGA